MGNKLISGELIYKFGFLALAPQTRVVTPAVQLFHALYLKNNGGFDLQRWKLQVHSAIFCFELW